jgi:hypothetical protein
MVGSEKISMIDGFLRYKQVRMDPKYVLKTTFTILWGTFSYIKIPFKLINAKANIQRAMDYAFVHIKDPFIVIYLYDMIVFRITIVDHQII